MVVLGGGLTAKLLGNMVLYNIGRYIGSKVIEILIKKLPKSEQGILKAEK